MIELLKVRTLVIVARVLAFVGMKAHAVAVVTRATRRVGEIVGAQR
jgi:hypothetical protein